MSRARCLDEMRQARGIQEITFERGSRARTSGIEFPHQRRSLLCGAAVVQDQARARGVQSARDGRPDTARRAGHEDGLTGKRLRDGGWHGASL